MITVNLLLAVVWVALTGDVSVVNFAAGFLLGYGILALVDRGAKVRSPYFNRVRRVLRLVRGFATELIRSNLKIAYEVVTPPHGMRPGIVAVPLDTRSDTETLILANLITLTPGTLTVEIDAEGKTLYMHDMYVEDPEKTRAAVKEGFEKLVREAMR